MNAATLLALSALYLPTHGPHHGHDGGHGAAHDAAGNRGAYTCPSPVVAAFDQLDDTLRHLAADVDGFKPNGERATTGGTPAPPSEERRAGRAQLRDAAATALARSQHARRVACRETRDDGPAVIVVQPAPQPVPAAAVLVLDEPHLRELVAGVRREAFDDGRLGVLALGVRDVCVTSTQARDLVKEMTFSQARIDAVRVLAPRIVDRDRSHLVLESLTFDSDRRSAREVLTTTSPAPQCVARRS